MKTRELAKLLNAIEVINVDQILANQSRTAQIFHYLLVLDFESTCWDRSHTAFPSEVIEFPVVLYDTKTQTCLEEFQRYVKPKEHPHLSEFCTQLTGIRQEQVDQGIDIRTCLEICKQWIDEITIKYDMEFPHVSETGKKKCVFVTWTNWDLGTCLINECSRKGIEFPDMFRKWVDLQQLYKVNYKRPLNGLEGALKEVGLKFEGRPHCGLDDARNTARLAGRMIDSNILLTLSKSQIKK